MNPTPVIHPPGRSAVRWNILGLLFAASAIAYFLRYNMSIAGEQMIADLGLTQVQLGLILAAFAWGYALFQIPGGVWGDRVGPRLALTIIAVLWGLFNLLVGLVPGATVVPLTVILGALIVLRFLMGVAQAPLYPVTGGGMTCNWFPVAGWAFPNGLSNAALTLGSAAAGPLTVWLTQTLGWRQAFTVMAPLGFLLAIVWWWYARDTPGEHRAVHEDELTLIMGDRPAPSTTPERGAWKKVLLNRNVLLLTLSYFCSNYVFYFFFNWLFIYLVDNRGFKQLESGYYAAAPWVAGAVGALVGGVMADRLSKRLGIRLGCRLTAVSGLLLAGGLILAAATATDPRVAVVLLSLCLACQQSTEGAFWAATIAVSGTRASTACGVLNTGGNVVGGIGALLVPITVKALGWEVALGTGSVFALAGAILWFWIRADSELPTSSETPALRAAD